MTTENSEKTTASNAAPASAGGTSALAAAVTDRDKEGGDPPAPCPSKTQVEQRELTK